jgi:hypothetical protein
LGTPVVPEVKNIAAVSLPPPLLDLLIDQARIAGKGRLAELEQLLVAHELRLVVMAQAARVVVVNAAQARALRLDLEQLVDLLLVFGERVGDLGVLDGKLISVATASWYSGTGMPPRHCAAHTAA